MQITRPTSTFDDRRIGLIGKFQELSFLANNLLLSLFRFSNLIKGYLPNHLALMNLSSKATCSLDDFTCIAGRSNHGRFFCHIGNCVFLTVNENLWDQRIRQRKSSHYILTQLVCHSHTHLFILLQTRLSLSTKERLSF